MPRFHSIVSLILPMFLALGCGSSGPDLVPVTGSVTIDGQPVADAGVLFTPIEGGRPGRASTDSQGQFMITTFKTGDGALVGKCVITVAKVETAAVSTVNELPMPSGRPDNGRWLLPKKYASPASSGLSAEVKPGMEPVALKLSSQ